MVYVRQDKMRSLRSVWMHPWDLEQRPAGSVLDRLEAVGLNSCHLAVCYHGGRLLLPTHPARRVLDLGPGGSYLPLDVTAFPVRALAPPYDFRWKEWIDPFLNEAFRRKFPVHAWVVLNHRDPFPDEARPYCTLNEFGDCYPHALCPSHLDVRQAFAELCRQIERHGGFAGIQLEGIGYLGYTHESAHNKAGVELSAEDIQRLSRCCCSACRAAPDRVAIEQDELRLIRQAVKLPLCLRTAARPNFYGGKSSLTAAQAAGLADSLSVTFFGMSIDGMRSELAAFCRSGFDGPVYGGFVFHHPDCRSEADVHARAGLLLEAQLDGTLFYCAGLAGEAHWRWLRAATAL